MPIFNMYLFFQTTEEEMFGNANMSSAFEEFLGIIGDRVSLKDFEVSPVL